MTDTRVESLAAARQWALELFDRAPVAVVELDDALRVRRLNAAASEWLGSLEGTPVAELVPSEDQGHVVGLLQGLLARSAGALTGEHGLLVSGVPRRVRSRASRQAGAILVQLVEIPPAPTWSEARVLAAPDRAAPETASETTPSPRAGIEAALAERLAEPAPGGALVLVDLDRFGELNEAHGPAAADRLLAAVAAELDTCWGQRGLVAHLGSDEFALWLPEADAAAARACGLEICELVESSSRRIVPRAWPPVTASVGVALVEGGDDPARMWERGVRACDQVKANGRDGTLVAGDRAQTELWWVDRLDLMCERIGPELLVRPVIDVSSGRVVDHRLLACIRDDGDRLVDERVWRPVALELGRAGLVGRRLLERSIEAIAAAPGVSLMLEVDAASLVEARAALVELARRQGVDPARLTLVLAGEPTADEVRELADVGFGIGLAASGQRLSNLARLPLTLIEVDEPIVSELPDRSWARATVAALRSLAASRGISLVATGVATEEALLAVRELGIQRMAGPFVATPRPLASLGCR